VERNGTINTPTGALRGTSVEALLPTVLAGLAITELPEFVATQYFLDKQLEPVLTDWRLPEGGLYFVTATARARPAKVSALADFFISKLTLRNGAQRRSWVETIAPPQEVKRACSKACRAKNLQVSAMGPIPAAGTLKLGSFIAAIQGSETQPLALRID